MITSLCQFINNKNIFLFSRDTNICIGVYLVTHEVHWLYSTGPSTLSGAHFMPCLQSVLIHNKFQKEKATECQTRGA